MERRRAKVPSARLEIVRRVQRQQGSLTVRPTGRAGAKAGLSDPAVASGSAVAQRIKGTPGITGLSSPRVTIGGAVLHLDVGPPQPGAEVGPKGWAVRPLKRYASWVQNVVRQFGPYLPWALELCEESSLVREDRYEQTSGVSVVVPTALLISHVWMG